MIAYLKGLVQYNSKDLIIIDVNNVGYQVLCANGYDFPLNKEVVVYTYQHVREDAIILFGFSSQKDCDFFQTLISVKGVGPKTGLGILGASGVSRLIKAVEEQDINYLKQLPGIGPKSASQIILDLKGKLISESIETSDNKVLNDVYDALISLGFSQKEINTIKNELQSYESEDLSTLIKYGLKLLNGKRG